MRPAVRHSAWSRGVVDGIDFEARVRDVQFHFDGMERFKRGTATHGIGVSTNDFFESELAADRIRNKHRADKNAEGRSG